MNDLLQELGETLLAETNEKVKRAMQLFIKIDMAMKGVVLHASGFSGMPTAKNLRDHFDNMDLLDELDNCIEDMQWDFDNS